LGQGWGQNGLTPHYPILGAAGDVWNRLVDQHIATALPEPRVAIRQYLLLSDRNQPNLDALIDRMRAANTDQRRASHNCLLPITVAEAHQLATAAVWPAWNAVEGPQRRSDDPQNRYFDRFTPGLTAEEANRMRAIETLFHDFEAFINAGPAPGPVSLRTLAQAASTARLNVYCDSPIRYRPEMWVQVGPDIWRKPRNGEQ
jgi:hypothetical protein